jgi:anthranilate phosphoribosyltransferase
MIKEATGKVVLRRDLTEEEMRKVMEEITAGTASDAQIASFITALRMKGETPQEIAVAAKVIKDKVSMIQGGEDVVCLDREEITVERETILSTAKGLTQGTKTFNISTATAFVVAGGGLKVAKHGRKSVSPLCGSADVVEALGINLDMTSTQLERCMKEIGICFLYGPLAQNGLRHIVTLREKIGIRTVFNLLEPLINPANAKTQALGVYEPRLTETMAAVLKNLEIQKGLVFHGQDTLDEMSITGRTKVTEFKGGRTKTYFVKPEDFGMKRRKLIEIEGGDKEKNAEIVVEILNGARGAKRDITVLNAAAVFMIAGRAKNLDEGIELAGQSIDSGEASKKLEKVIRFTNTERRYLRDPYEVEMGRSPAGHFQGF